MKEYKYKNNSYNDQDRSYYYQLKLDEDRVLEEERQKIQRQKEECVRNGKIIKSQILESAEREREERLGVMKDTEIEMNKSLLAKSKAVKY